MIKIMLPATTANFGPGFDLIGAALTLYNTFIFQPQDQGFELRGVPEIYNNENNLIFKSFNHTLQLLKKSCSGLLIDVKSTIPIAKGLGSSATCILAGVLAANAFAESPLDKSKVLKIAAAIEGHPDNLAPCLYGGIKIVFDQKGDFVIKDLPFSKEYFFVALIPDYMLSTKEARAVLPSQFPLDDVKTNIKNISFLIYSLMTADYQLLDFFTKDRVHTPYRQNLIKDYDLIIEKAKKQGALTSFISGAGPTIMSLIPQNNLTFVSEMREELNKLAQGYQILKLSLDQGGAKVITANTEKTR